MRKTLLASLALGALLMIETPSFAQGISIGPGGVRVDDGRRYGRGYEREYRDDRRYSRMCARLRDACRNKDIYGEGGQGNCSRYRRNCG